MLRRMVNTKKEMMLFLGCPTCKPHEMCESGTAESRQLITTTTTTIIIMMMMTIIITIIIIITTTTTTIIIIALKGANQDFFNPLTAQRTPTRTLKWPRHNRVQITCNTSSAYHVQHVVCHVIQRDSSAIKFDKVDIVFLAVFYRLKPLTYEGGEETGVPGENP